MSSKHGYAAALSLLVGCGLGALAGCTGGAADPPATGNGTAATGATTRPPASSSPPTTTTSTTTTTATVQIPEAARAHTEAGAEAFVKFFMDQVSEAWTRPATGLILPLGEAGCLSCQSFEDTAAGLVKRSERYAKRPSTTVSAQAVPGGGPRQLVHLVLQQHRVDVVDVSGKTVLTDSRKRFSVDAELNWGKGRWWLHDMG